MTLLALALCSLPAVVEAYTFLVFGDIHYDPSYGTSKAMNADKHECGEGAPTFGSFGCDSPKSLVESALDDAKERYPNPDGLFYLGDFTRHFPWPTSSNISEPVALECVHAVSEMISERWPNTNFMYGNNDFPSDYEARVYTNEMPGPPGSTQNLEDPWNAEIDRQMVGTNFTAEQRATFLHGGYYVKEEPAGSNLFFISLNTVIYNEYAQDFISAEYQNDPNGQFAWLQSTLQDVRAKGGKAFLMGHVPPTTNKFGYDNQINMTLYRDQFYALINEFDAEISGMFWAHLHRTQFRLTNTTYPMSYFSSVSPIYWNNPTYSSITLDSDSGAMIGANYFVADMPSSGEWIPEWRLFEPYLNLPNFTTRGYQEFWDKASQDSYLFNQYYNGSTSFSPQTEEVDNSRAISAHAYLCADKFIDREDWEVCNKTMPPFGCVDNPVCQGDNVHCVDGKCVAACPSPSDACCAPGGCADAQYLQCVGQFDPYCEFVGWDHQCVYEAQEKCGLQC